MRRPEYRPLRIERLWQRYWEREGTFKVLEDPYKPKFYCLVMFPYPSGRIHMGHVRVYTIGDVIARYKMLSGFSVLHPMGWDAFGLPAENAAIEKGIQPARWTRENIAAMRRQLKKLGLSYDWEREIATCQEGYYRWNQWFFLRMYERGLAYKKMSAQNWCPSCQTVLANEQVVEGQCWRCEAAVEQKELSQWFFKITDYAEELLEECDHLEGWPERVLAMQRNWIGRSKGVEVAFPLAEGNPPAGGSKTLQIFTTRPDTLFGATFVILAPEHPWVENLIQNSPEAGTKSRQIDRMKQQDRKSRTAQDLEKEGVFTGAYAVNPLTQEKIPIWVANFVLMEYGTGAIMSVPAHDQRDYEFAKKYGLPIRVVIQDPKGSLQSSTLAQAYTEESGYLIDSGPFSGLSPKEAQSRIADDLEHQGTGKRKVHYKLRDWGVSRQRYWGTPIPIVYCEGCGIVPVPDSQLPVRLPGRVPLTGRGGSPLLESKSFLKTPCPRCGKKARRETDTMDTFVDSSWYFLRYISPHLKETPVDPRGLSYWMPVDQYVGGIEHAVLHLLYARFFTKIIRDLDGSKEDNGDSAKHLNEPFTRLLTQGMVVKESSCCPEHGYLFPEQVSREGLCELCLKENNRTTVQVGRTEKMSKSKKNIVDPEALVQRYGADTARLFVLFAAPPEKDLEWSDEGVEGAYRFLNRAWRLVTELAGSLKEVEIRPDAIKGLMSELTPGLRSIRRAVHLTIKKVTEDIEDHYHFNTAIAALMELVNNLYLAKRDLSTVAQPDRISRRSLDPQTRMIWKEALQTLVILFSPFVPHIAEELWKRLGNTDGLFNAKWPVHDEAVIQAEVLTIVIQVNGKLRGKMEVPAELDESTIKQRALDHPNIQTWISGKNIRTLVYIPRRLVNIVV